MSVETEMDERKNSTRLEVKIMKTFAWITLIGGLIVAALTAIGAASINAIYLISAVIPWFIGSILSFAVLMAFASVTDNIENIRQHIENKK